jgi:thiol-disulfide isomerase/thioredoxin
MKRLLTVLMALTVIANSWVVAQTVTHNQQTLPDWPHKYATTVIRAKITGGPMGKGHTNFGYPNELFGKCTPEDIIDSAGIFQVKFRMNRISSWSLMLPFTPLDFNLCPGDTIDIDFDYAKAQQLKDVKPRLYAEAVKVRGGYIPWRIEYENTRNSLREQFLDDKGEFKKQYPNEKITEYREFCFKRYQNIVEQLKATNLTHIEKVLAQLSLESAYVTMLRLHYKGADEKTMEDPHSRELLFPQTTLSMMGFENIGANYFDKNNLWNLPFGQYLTQYKKAQDMVTRIKALEDVPDDTINALLPDFRDYLLFVKGQMNEVKAKGEWRPTGTPDTWLQQIVDRHKGKVVFIDYWTTWCDHCNLAINEMVKVKEQYEKRGVDFVYMTDESSTLDGYLKMRAQQKGDHFLFKRTDRNKMNIPSFGNRIPHYLFYDRNGKLIKSISGGGSLEEMCGDLDKALGDR